MDLRPTILTSEARELVAACLETVAAGIAGADKLAELFRSPLAAISVVIADDGLDLD